MKIIRIAQQLKLKHLCEVKTNSPDADFWLQRKGDEKTVGTPTKNFSPENIGIRVGRTDIVDPDYLFYVFQFLHSSGKLKNFSKGSLNLQHITVEDIKDISIG